MVHSGAMTTQPPGWYPDASLPGQERWWDGNAWSSVTRAIPDSSGMSSVFGAPSAPQDPGSDAPDAWASPHQQEQPATPSWGAPGDLSGGGGAGGSVGDSGYGSTPYGRYEQNQPTGPHYGQDPYSAPQSGQPSYGQQPFQQPQDGQPQYGQDPYAARQYGQPAAGQYGEAGAPGQPGQPGQHPAYGAPSAPYPSSYPSSTPYDSRGFGPASGPGSLASPLARLGARIVDIILIGIVTAIIGAPFLGEMLGAFQDYLDSLPTDGSQAPDPTEMISIMTSAGWRFSLVSLVVSAAYYVSLTALRGATLGKSLVGLKVQRLADGQRPNWFDAGVRWAVDELPQQLIGPLWWIEHLWCLWDPKRQTIHDKPAKTVVVRSR